MILIWFSPEPFNQLFFDEFCFAVIFRYIVLFVLTLLALLLWPTSSTSFWRQCWSLVVHSKQLIACIVSRSETKEKDEDANYEYEMMWDAEGSMHLVKKPLNASTVNSNERSVGERYTLVSIFFAITLYMESIFSSSILEKCDLLFFMKNSSVFLCVYLLAGVMLWSGQLREKIQLKKQISLWMWIWLQALGLIL